MVPTTPPQLLCLCDEQGVAEVPSLPRGVKKDCSFHLGHVCNHWLSVAPGSLGLGTGAATWPVGDLYEEELRLQPMKQPSEGS